VEEHARLWLGEFIDTAAGIDHYRRDVVEHILPAVGARPLVEVSTAEMATLLEQVGAATSEAVADQVAVTLREWFPNAFDVALIGRSPMPASQRAAAAPPHGDID
jgi:hypothetical protein